MLYEHKRLRITRNFVSFRAFRGHSYPFSIIIYGHSWLIHGNSCSNKKIVLFVLYVLFHSLYNITFSLVYITATLPTPRIMLMARLISAKRPASSTETSSVIF